MLFIPLQLNAMDLSLTEYKLKAALIYRLIMFVDWPEQAQQTVTGSFGICVLGDDPFGTALDALQQRKARQYAIKIYRYSQSDSITNECQVVFISASKQAFQATILRVLKKFPILTIGETEDFAQQGGMIQFATGEKRINFIINPVSAEAVGLKIASPLLDLSTVIDTGFRTE
ncbi:MAG: YfiR family protein [Gammaproteobacteria bacterium]